MRRRLLPAWIALGLVLWSAAVFFTVDGVRRHLEDARKIIDEVRDSDDITLTTVTNDMARLDKELRAADELADSPVLASAKWLPVLGRQLDVVDQVAETGAALSAPLRRVTELAQAGPTGNSGPEHLAFLDALIIEVSQIDDVFRRADLGPSDHLFAQVADARSDVATALADNQEEVRAGRDALVAIRRMLDGGTYLLLGANNAEMRTAGGMVLSIGSIDTFDGDFRLNRITPTNERFPVPESPVVDADIDALWGFLRPTNDYRKLTYTARFDQYTGPQAVAMWQADTGTTVDGAILIDSFVIEAVLAASGPVQVDGRTIDDAEAVEYLLRGQYERYGDAEERRDQLAELAAAVFVRLQEGDLDFGTLIGRLPAMVRGRHLMVYSSDPTAQGSWETLGIAGQVEGDEAGVFLHNLGGSKLDPLLDVNVDVRHDVTAETRTVRFDIEITNTVTDAAGIAPYVLGPWEDIGLPEAGTYSARVVVYAPGSVSNLRFSPSRQLEALGHDGPLAIMATKLRIGPGETVRLTARFDLPVDATTLTVIPSARYPAVHWTGDGLDRLDTEPFAVDLGD